MDRKREVVNVMDQNNLPILYRQRHDPFEYFDAQNIKLDHEIKQRKVAAAERERNRNQFVVRDGCVSVPVEPPRQSAMEIQQRWVEQKLDELRDQVREAINRADVELGEVLIAMIAEGVNEQNERLRSQLEQLKAELHKDRMIAKGELTVLPPFIKSNYVA
jgi:hypothetical protein